MSNFASYAFNKSHAVCYAYIGVITAFMACHWTQEFYAAMLNAFITTSDKVKEYLQQAKTRGIKLLPPDINRSQSLFSPDGQNIRFGLQGISGVKAIAPDIIAERERNGNFESIQDAYDRIIGCSKANKTAFENMAYAGAFDSFNRNRAQVAVYLQKLEKRPGMGRNIDGQLALFDIREIPMPPVPAFDPRKELELEYNVLGIYLNGHPSNFIIDAATKRGIPFEKIEDVRNFGTYHIIGVIRDLKSFTTKTTKKFMATFTLETESASIKCVVFPEKYMSCIDQLHDGALVGVIGKGSTDNRGEESSIQYIVEYVENEAAIIGGEGANAIEVFVHDKREQNIVLSFVKNNPGHINVVLKTQDENGSHYFPLKNHKVEPTLAAVSFLKGDHGYRKPNPNEEFDYLV